MKVPFLESLFVIEMREFGLERLKKKGIWSDIAFKEKGTGLAALKHLLGCETAPSKAYTGGTVTMYSVDLIGFSFKTKYLRLKGKLSTSA